MKLFNRSYFIKYTLSYIVGSAILSIIVSGLLFGSIKLAETALYFTIIFFTAYLSGAFGILFFRYFSNKSQEEIIKKVFPAIIIFWMGALIIATIIKSFVMYLWNYENSLNHGGYIISFEDFLFSLKALAPWIFITSVIFFYILWTKAVNREHKLNQQLLTFKYQTLKSQVNPHFLFNSLNVLTTLIHSDPLKAEQFTTKLSDIYRYILVNENNKLVLLSDELQFVRDYFDLQKVRDEDKIQLSIKIENENQYFIPPVSLQVLVENALKHNAASGQKPLVISVIQDSGFIKVVNNVQRKTNLQHSSGMGLENLKERIRLLTNQEVEIVETNNEFAVTIPLIDN